jgi:hypothetical protein
MEFFPMTQPQQHCNHECVCFDFKREQTGMCYLPCIHDTRSNAQTAALKKRPETCGDSDCIKICRRYVDGNKDIIINRTLDDAIKIIEELYKKAYYNADGANLINIPECQFYAIQAGAYSKAIQSLRHINPPTQEVT